MKKIHNAFKYQVLLIKNKENNFFKTDLDIFSLEDVQPALPNECIHLYRTQAATHFYNWDRNKSGISKNEEQILIVPFDEKSYPQI